MFNFNRLMGMAVVAIGLSSAPSFAATLNVDGAGQLLGASGVNVGGTFYDVEFKDGTCIALFDGCDEASDFTFSTSVDAGLAMQALASQVITGIFRTNPWFINGIGTSQYAWLWSPYILTTSTNVRQISLRLITGSPDGYPIINWTPDFDLTPKGADTYAIWSVSSPAAVVPLPAGGLLLLSALGGIATLRRRKKRTA